MAGEIKTLLVINSGSSTLKFELFGCDDLQSLYAGNLSVHSDQTYQIRPIFDTLQAQVENFASCSIEAIAHRVVHGGTCFNEAVVVNQEVLQTLESLSSLAPLHNPKAVSMIKRLHGELPDIPQIAVFDTGFFSNLPERAKILPLPWHWYEKWGIRRFGFHGISHSYCATRAVQMLKQALQPIQHRRLVICHIGSGCSASAVQDGEAVATTMSYTPMDGLMMGSRSGSIDPGILLHLLDSDLQRPEQISDCLNRQSGLLGVSGVSSDFQQVHKAAQQGNSRAQLALDIFTDSIRASIASLAVNMGGLDALIFTAGIGENSSYLREKVCQGLECLGCVLDLELNQQPVLDAELTAAGSKVRILAIATQESLQIAKQTLPLITSTA
ncbi:MAG: acetate/propionate family kinase [Verrucomicrobiota bacterium]